MQGQLSRTRIADVVVLWDIKQKRHHLLPHACPHILMEMRKIERGIVLSGHGILYTLRHKAYDTTTMFILVYLIGNGLRTIEELVRNHPKTMVNF